MDEQPVESVGQFYERLLRQERAENERLRVALRYWLPDETLIPQGHEIAWYEHVALIPEHRSSVVRTT